MPSAIDPSIRKQVITQYLNGLGRNQIARNLNVGQGTVTGIIETWKQGVEGSDPDYQAIRDLAIHCRKEGFGRIADYRQAIRIKNYLAGLGPNIKEENIEPFIASLMNSSDPSKLIEAATQISESGIPLETLEEHVRVLKSEKETLQREIDEGRAILDGVYEDEESRRKLMEEYAQMKAEMRRYGIKIGPEDPKRFSRLIQALQRGNYDCAKILNAFADIDDVNRRRLEVDLDRQDLERRLEECHEILQLAEHLLRLGINFDQAIAWIESIHECAEAEKIGYKAAAYRVLQDLSNLRLYRHLGSLQRNIQQAQQYLTMLNMLTAEKQQALMILQVLQGLGVTIDEIYGLSKIVDLRRLGNSKQWPPKGQESFAIPPMQPPSQLQNGNGDNNTQSLSQWLTAIRDGGRTLYKY